MAKEPWTVFVLREAANISNHEIDAAFNAVLVDLGQTRVRPQAHVGFGPSIGAIHSIN
ncbi:hypothetical protein [Methylobacterium oryzae]|uniref:hypothetical protein n=1 Tax=Methylobacterium oryzae TaxID=334852 RepID=UPI001F198E9E|nr:hypothetical protein [Methylobacterium oryzae]UIN34047.1 hypothetical protein LXM90_23660 [Methylobacterium oryzae]